MKYRPPILTPRRARLLWVCQSCRQISNFSSPIRERHSLLTGQTARTRFAPSPTGYLHLGSLRTALFNYLIAKATKGQFILRIEDTDQKRTVPDAEERLYRDLEWAGIEWDEGPKIGGPYGPYHQSQRTSLYRKHAALLVESGKAYRCFCTPERLHTLAQHKAQLGLPPDYDRTCAHISKSESVDRASNGEAHVVRLKVPDLYPEFNDMVYGTIRQRKGSSLVVKSFDDPVLLKSDGFPTYHLANVVDDHLMGITHVIRGSEWISSTPKHLAMYQAFGWTPPSFAHVGLLLNKQRQKLSKRDGAVDINSFREKGIFPEALTNFVALLGWSHNEKQDLMSMEDLIKRATMKYTRGDTIVGFEKLDFLQKKHAARYAEQQKDFPPLNPNHDLMNLAVQPVLSLINSDHSRSFSFYGPDNTSPAQYVRSVVFIDARKYTTPTDFLARNVYFFCSPTKETLVSTIPGLKLHNVPKGITHGSLDWLLQFFSAFLTISPEDWNTEELKRVGNFIIDQGAQRSMGELKGKQQWTEELELRLRKEWGKLVHQYLRWAVAAGMPGPEGAEMLRVLGRREVGVRLGIAQEVVKEVYGLEAA